MFMQLLIGYEISHGANGEAADRMFGRVCIIEAAAAAEAEAAGAKRPKTMMKMVAR